MTLPFLIKKFEKIEEFIFCFGRFFSIFEYDYLYLSFMLQ